MGKEPEASAQASDEENLSTLLPSVGGMLKIPHDIAVHEHL
jgi:hypothetical protein